MDTWFDQLEAHDASESAKMVPRSLAGKVDRRVGI